MTEQRKLKIIVLGESGVGKTSLLVRYKDGTYRESYKYTNLDLLTKTIRINNTSIHLEMWDTAGFEKCRTYVRGYFRDSHGVLLIYDVTNMTTFNTLESWLSDLRKENETAVVLIVGNKNDDPDRKSVNRKVVKGYAESKDMEYMETSAKTGDNVNEVFDTLIRRILGIPLDDNTDSSNADSGHCSDAEEAISNNRKVYKLPPIVPLRDEGIIKLSAQTDKLRKDDDFCC
ncbi:hypothetical protein JTE90_023731 [Oedothorax gibbosus]|uniref:Ras-related protein Rab-18 n=1 Tax=Oedothorax gibbosus TaxID=931172 RepID=A0AAV6VBW5_9ARAC|nr:hypothetical protein JTE90_023731 [Oedothorax gibbosus]